MTHHTDMLIKATAVQGAAGYYCLGPFARQVSFIAQQYRALNLVWALHRRGDCTASDRVAVIGGGLAGMTAAVAFLAHGCEVHLFERHKLMSRQRETEHRMVHPSINLWPLRDLRATTELPFLEWHVGRCHDVTRHLLEQFRSIEEANQPKLKTFEKCDVTEVLVVHERGLKVRHTPIRASDSIYNIVLLTVGFGKETPYNGFDQVDYWRVDGLEATRDIDQNATFIVSGCGDGGLIDALRLVHRDFGRGQLAFRCAALLEGTDVWNAVKTAEDTCRDAAGLPELARAYRAAGDSLATDSTSVGKILRDSLDQSALVYLVGHALDWPYALNAAPIHKLLIAHAVASGMITYWRGEIARHQDGHILAKELTFAAGTRVIIRHGAEPEFGRLLTLSQQNALRSNQWPVLDGFATQQWTDSYRVPNNIVDHRIGTPEFAIDRHRLALRASRAVHEDCNLARIGGSYVAEHFGQPEWTPPDFFGVPVSWRAMTTPVDMTDG